MRAVEALVFNLCVFASESSFRLQIVFPADAAHFRGFDRGSGTAGGGARFI